MGKHGYSLFGVGQVCAILDFRLSCLNPKFPHFFLQKTAKWHILEFCKSNPVSNPYFVHVFLGLCSVLRAVDALAICKISALVQAETLLRDAHGIGVPSAMVGHRPLLVVRVLTVVTQLAQPAIVRFVPII